MELIVGVIFKMKRVTYNGKTESVYKYETIDIGGYLKNMNSRWSNTGKFSSVAYLLSG